MRVGHRVYAQAMSHQKIISRLIVPGLCIFHMLVIFWWVLPRQFEILQLDNAYNNSPLFVGEEKVLNALGLSEQSSLRWVLEQYINVTGSQQYWDFFAPAAPKFHQYFSICDAEFIASIYDKINCNRGPVFLNLMKAVYIG